MRPLRSIALVLFFLFLAHPLIAQKDKPEPLTEAQIEQIREAGIAPNERVSLYTKFLNEHADTIKGLTNRSKSLARAKRLDEELQNLTALMDELGSNLDTFSDRHADIRKALKPLTEASEHWLGILRALAGEITLSHPRLHPTRDPTSPEHRCRRASRPPRRSSISGSRSSAPLGFWSRCPGSL